MGVGTAIASRKHARRAKRGLSVSQGRRKNVARSLRMDEQDSRTFDGEMTDAGRRELKDLEGQV